jgi:hypothetical protein
MIKNDGIDTLSNTERIRLQFGLLEDIDVITIPMYAVLHLSNASSMILELKRFTIKDVNQSYP